MDIQDISKTTSTQCFHFSLIRILWNPLPWNRSKTFACLGLGLLMTPLHVFILHVYEFNHPFKYSWNSIVSFQNITGTSKSADSCGLLRVSYILHMHLSLWQYNCTQLFLHFRCTLKHLRVHFPRTYSLPVNQRATDFHVNFLFSGKQYSGWL